MGGYTKLCLIYLVCVSSGCGLMYASESYPLDFTFFMSCNCSYLLWHD